MACPLGSGGGTLFQGVHIIALGCADISPDIVAHAEIASRKEALDDSFRAALPCFPDCPAMGNRV
jgi:hypothetical protein